MFTTTLRRPQGFAVIKQPDGSKRECDTVTCSHCNKIVFLWPDEPGKQPADLLRTCGMCDANRNQICLACAKRQRAIVASGRTRGACIPFERQLEHMEAGGRFMQAALGKGEAQRNLDEDRRRRDLELREKEVGTWFDERLREMNERNRGR